MKDGLGLAAPGPQIHVVQAYQHVSRIDDLPRLPYNRMVIEETLRLFPPAWSISRQSLEPDELGGYRLPAKGSLNVSIDVVHHDPRFWPDPLRFDPDRFTPEARAARPRFAYFPFGGGARSCIGEPFAWMEGVLLLAAIGQRWRLRLVPGHPVEPQAMITLRPRYGMRMTVEAP